MLSLFWNLMSDSPRGTIYYQFIYFLLLCFSSKFISATIICNMSLLPGDSHKDGPPESVSFAHTPDGPDSYGILNVINIYARKKEFKYVVCVHGPLRGDYPTKERFIEHVEMQFILGADKYVIYNNTAADHLTRVVEYYKKNGRVDLYQWKPPPHRTHNGGQLSLIQDCLYKYMYRTEYLILHDVDEFIIPRSTYTWDGMLANSQCNQRGVAMFRNVWFYSDEPDDSVFTSNTTLTKLKSTVTLQKTRRMRNPRPCGRNSKLMVMPEKVIFGSVHVVEKSLEDPCCVEVDLALLQHYRLRQSKARDIIRDSTALKYQNDLVRAVKKVYSDLN